MDEQHTTYEVLCKVVEEAEAARNRALLENEIISSVSRMYFAIFRIDLLHDFYEEVSSDTSIHILTGHSGKAQQKMNAILGYEKLIRAGLTDPKLLHYQDRMEQASEILLSLINNVLDMARIESGRMELDETCHKVGNVISSVNEVFEVAAKEKGLEFEYHTEVCHSYIMCDITKVQEIFTNLISNAVKYTQPGGKISVVTRELPYDREGYILIETVVEDTGIGMSREFLPHLFDEFSRERNTTSGKVAGTGLGMPIVKRLVELMKGKIEVESALGKGSRFSVIIPHRLADKKTTKEKWIFHHRIENRRT